MSFGGVNSFRVDMVHGSLQNVDCHNHYMSTRSQFFYLEAIEGKAEIKWWGKRNYGQLAKWSFVVLIRVAATDGDGIMFWICRRVSHEIGLQWSDNVTDSIGSIIPWMIDVVGSCELLFLSFLSSC